MVLGDGEADHGRVQGRYGLEDRPRPVIRGESRDERARIGGPTVMAFGNFPCESHETRCERGLRRVEKRGGVDRAFHVLTIPSWCANAMASRLRTGRGALVAPQKGRRMSDRTTVHFIRHGDALPLDGDVVGAPGYDGLGLSAIGRRQAEALARRLTATFKLDAIYTSPTPRAYETAATLARGMPQDVRIDPRLCELDFGPEPFGDAGSVRARLADLASMALRDGSWAAVPDAETAASVRTRMTACVDDIRRSHPSAQVAVVSHAGAINAYLAGMLGVRRSFFFAIANASLSSIRITAEAHVLVRLNDTAHLETIGRIAPVR